MDGLSAPGLPTLLSCLPIIYLLLLFRSTVKTNTNRLSIGLAKGTQEDERNRCSRELQEEASVDLHPEEDQLIQSHSVETQQQQQQHSNTAQRQQNNQYQ